MTESVVEETRTEVSVEEVTETRYRCHVCEMAYDADEVLRIGLDRTAADGDLFANGAEPRAERTICHHCDDGLFDYEPDGESVFAESETQAGIDRFDVVAAHGVILLLVALVAGVFGLFAAGAGVSVLAPPATIAATVGGYILRGWLQ